YYQLPLFRLCGFHSVVSDRRLQPVSILENIINILDWHPLLTLILVENPNVLLGCIVEVQAAERLPVVIVEQDAAVTLHVAHDNPPRVNHFTEDSSDNMISFPLLFRGFNLPTLAILGQIFNRLME